MEGKYMPSLCFEVPYPPSINHAYMTVAHGKRVLKPEAAAYRGLVCYVSRVAKQRYGIPELPLQMSVEVFTPDRRRRDLDNLLKVMQDAISDGIGVDDSQITTLIMRKAGVMRNGVVRIAITHDATHEWFAQQSGFDDSRLIVWNALQ
jgi:crossover junction endodeoxyribonuclease RusA